LGKTISSNKLFLWSNCDRTVRLNSARQGGGVTVAAQVPPSRANLGNQSGPYSRAPNAQSRRASGDQSLRTHGHPLQALSRRPILARSLCLIQKARTHALCVPCVGPAFSWSRGSSTPCLQLISGFQHMAIVLGWKRAGRHWLIKIDVAKVEGVSPTWTRSHKFYPLHPVAQASNNPLIKRETWFPHYMFTLSNF
jgi:hypothetical protein